MEREMAFKWADELKSGKHLQGRSYLEYIDDNGTVRRCCLGVAARMVCGYDNSNRVHNVEYGDVFKTYFDGWTGILSTRLKSDLGMRHPKGEITSFRTREGDPIWLTDLNDSGFTFSQIADMIRYFYEEL